MPGKALTSTAPAVRHLLRPWLWELRLPAGVLGLKGSVSGGLRSVNVEDAESVGGSVMAGSEG